MRQIPLNTEGNGKIAHCPLTTHPYGYYWDVLPGFKPRCNKEIAVLEIFCVNDKNI